MKATETPPTKPGYYWWTNFGEHTPTIVRVTRCNRKLYATDGEYDFIVGKKKTQRIEIDDDDEPIFEVDGQKFYYGQELWSEKPIPEFNFKGKKLGIDCF